ncbi:hypothetical protein CVT25_014789 [Psilocybe cyanescens]|uniref:Uncharacterized protein n=1 Tax=Psilocybe cyanescens TaxID=93625 RepID=A0A409X8R6_PSICY|nr:hypothetical protein CVT25_014789 [Psilocybe cyanescens]
MPIVASQSVRNGVCTVALSWPAAATMRHVAASTVGWDVSALERDAWLHGVSRDGKSIVGARSGTGAGTGIELSLDDAAGTNCGEVAIVGEGGGET